MLTAVRQVSEGKPTNRITLETLCGLFHCDWIDIESDTCFRNITWGSLTVGCPGVVRKDDCGCYSSECGRLMSTNRAWRGFYIILFIFLTFHDFFIKNKKK